MKQFITEAQRLQKLAGITELKVMPNTMSGLNSKELYKILEDYWDNVDSQWFIDMGIDSKDEIKDQFPGDLVVSELVWLDLEKPLDDFYKAHKEIRVDGNDYTDTYLRAKKEVEKPLEVSEIKIIPPVGNVSSEDLIEKIIDLYIDLIDPNSNKLDKILSKYIPDRIRLNSNLSYKEMFEMLDQQTLEKLYDDLRRISEIKIMPAHSIQSITSPNSRHPELYNFIRFNLKEIISSITSDSADFFLSEFNLSPDNIGNITVENKNHYDYITPDYYEDNTLLPQGQDIQIYTPEMEDENYIITIANHPLEYSDEGARPLKGYDGLYWDMFDY